MRDENEDRRDLLIHVHLFTASRLRAVRTVHRTLYIVVTCAIIL